MDIALALIRHPDTNALLIARRAANVHQGGLWEFPGGKCLPEETPEACAVRESREETGLEVEVLEAWSPLVYTYPDRTVTLYPFLCRARTDAARPLGNCEVAWVLPGALDQYPFPPANAPLLARLRGEESC